MVDPAAVADALVPRIHRWANKAPGDLTVVCGLVVRHTGQASFSYGYASLPPHTDYYLAACPVCWKADLLVQRAR